MNAIFITSKNPGLEFLKNNLERGAIMLLFVLGLISGMLLTSFILNKAVDGTLKIDHSNPEKDTYRFEIDKLDNLSKSKRVILKVDNDADLSQK